MSTTAKHMLYFALQPPPPVAAQALALAEDARREHGLVGKATPAARLHVSLNFVGEFKRPPGPVAGKVLEAVRHVAVRPFVVEFNRLAGWGRGDGVRPVVLWGEDGVVGVHDLYSALHKALGRYDFAPRREAPIEPHMTLVYGGAEIPERFIDPVVRWEAREVVLIHAVHGEGRYEVAGRVPLSA
jgi:2'-5' RNA ligase